jgi:ABC-2 type transport system ATP-binding protein
MNPESPIALEVRDLAFLIGKKTLVTIPLLSLSKGNCLGVVGHNGAGKTTFFQILLGLKFPTKGSVRIGGVHSETPMARTGVGYVPERPYVDLEMRFFDFLKFHAELIGISKMDLQSEIGRVAREVTLEGHLNQRFKTFSKGMLQKALLAQAGLGDPWFLVLDEPMSGLDPEAREHVRQFIKKWKSEGKER